MFTIKDEKIEPPSSSEKMVLTPKQQEILDSINHDLQTMEMGGGKETKIEPVVEDNISVD